MNGKALQLPDGKLMGERFSCWEASQFYRRRVFQNCFGEETLNTLWRHW